MQTRKRKQLAQAPIERRAISGFALPDLDNPSSPIFPSTARFSWSPLPIVVKLYQPELRPCLGVSSAGTRVPVPKAPMHENDGRCLLSTTSGRPGRSA